MIGLMTIVSENAPAEPGYSEEVPPDPAALIESMRAFGYSLPAAIADLIDNSITAGARHVDVRLHWAGDDSWIAVSDDGGGMRDAELTKAMQLATRNPNDPRNPADLGRFGLGLKTAAFSQARSLTVASRPPGSAVAVRRWDLDHVAERQSW